MRLVGKWVRILNVYIINSVNIDRIIKAKINEKKNLGHRFFIIFFSFLKYIATKIEIITI